MTNINPIQQGVKTAWTGIAGVISLLGGRIERMPSARIACPPFSVSVLVWVAGIWAIAIGVVQVVSAFQLRSAAKRAQQAVSGLAG